MSKLASNLASLNGESWLDKFLNFIHMRRDSYLQPHERFQLELAHVHREAEKADKEKRERTHIELQDWRAKGGEKKWNAFVEYCSRRNERIRLTGSLVAAEYESSPDVGERSGELGELSALSWSGQGVESAEGGYPART